MMKNDETKMVKFKKKLEKERENNQKNNELKLRRNEIRRQFGYLI